MKNRDLILMMLMDGVGMKEKIIKAHFGPTLYIAEIPFRMITFGGYLPVSQRRLDLPLVQTILCFEKFFSSYESSFSLSYDRSLGFVTFPPGYFERAANAVIPASKFCLKSFQSW